MAATPKRLYKGQLPTASTLLYTGPTNGAILKAIRVVNTDASARWVRLGTSGVLDSDLLIPQWSIDAQGLMTDDALIIVESGQTIYGQAEVASKLTVHLFGMEM